MNQFQIQHVYKIGSKKIGSRYNIDIIYDFIKNQEIFDEDDKIINELINKKYLKKYYIL